MGKEKFLLLFVLTLVLFLSLAFAQDLSGSVVGPQYVFDDPNIENITTRFQEIHNITETFYDSNGTWYSSPSATPWSARAALGYMSAYKGTNVTMFAARSREALDFLAANQGANGFWGNDTYQTGLAGVAMVEGYKIFGDSDYFQYSKDAADAELTLAQGECDGELNYCAFMLWHLANHYEITGDATYLNKATEMAQHVIDQQDQDTGYWSGDHSGEFSYHTIYTRGLVELVRAIPHDHPFEKTLIEATVRALNHTIIMQHSSGNFYVDPGQTTLATTASGTHPRVADITHTFINELGLDKIQDVLDGLTLYTIPLDLGPMNEDEQIMLLYATGVMIEAYGGTIIDMYFDPSMVTTTTTSPGGNGESGTPGAPGGGGPPPIEDTVPETTTSTMLGTTTPTRPTTDTTQGESGQPQTPIDIISKTTEDVREAITQQPLLVVAVVVATLAIIVAYRATRKQVTVK